MAKLYLLPKEPKFFAFFQQQAENNVKMVHQLKDMIYIRQNVKERASILADMEQDGDAITHDIMTLLHLSAVTPFDREDISALAYSLDDIADHIHEIADMLYLYGIEGPTDRAKELCDIILEAVLEVEGSVSEINFSMNKSELIKRCVTIHEIENFGDRVYRAALGELFEQPDNIAFIVKWRDIYNKMESAIDGCETFAGILEDIVIEYS
jgi:predicted phosphate transport protein (TIGR00153 family)